METNIREKYAFKESFIQKSTDGIRLLENVSLS